MSSPFSFVQSSSSSSPNLARREIPGNYGLPFFGSIKDRWDFFYFQGEDKFFRSRMENYNSTIFRVNMPPGPWISDDPRVIVLLDAKSFPILFDTSKVEKRDVFTGTYMPSTSYTGGYRVCSYLDPSEPNHGSIKTLLLTFLASKHKEFIPLFQSCVESLFSGLENQLKDTNRADFVPLNEILSLEFVFRLFCDGKSPSDTTLKLNGPSLIKKWLVGQISPIGTAELPKILYPIEDFILHSIGIPFFLVKNEYEKIYDAFSSSATTFLDKAESFGLSREEACNNLVFIAGFNSFGGFTTWFPSLMKWVGSAGETLHRDLADEIRSIVKSEGGITLKGINKMGLTKSVVYGSLRIEPPVPYQYGRAKQDLVIQTHDAEYEVKKGEMMFGFQPFATKDPKIFDEPEKFIGNRFVGKEGEKLVKYVFWSNGWETDEPKMNDKQCPGKNLVELISRVFLVEFFLRYDTFTVEMDASNLTFLSLNKANSY